MSKYDMVKEFHNIYGSYISKESKFPSQKVRELRKNLLDEEYNEYLKAEETNNYIEVCDALGDMLYIIYGTALSYGIPIDEVFEEIHKSNMSKLDENGNPIYREDGKILKGKNYFRPNIAKIISKD